MTVIVLENSDLLWNTPKLDNLISGLYSGTESAVSCGGTIRATSQLIQGYVRNMFLLQHVSALIRTMY